MRTFLALASIALLGSFGLATAAGARAHHLGRQEMMRPTLEARQVYQVIVSSNVPGGSGAATAWPVAESKNAEGKRLVHFVTAGHVLERPGIDSISIEIRLLPDATLQSTLQGTFDKHPTLDLGLVNVVTDFPVQLPQFADPVSGMRVIYSAWPLNTWLMTEGLVSFKDDDGHWISSAEVCPGSSGGKVISETGQVVGLILGGRLFPIRGNLTMSPHSHFLPASSILRWLKEKNLR